MPLSKQYTGLVPGWSDGQILFSRVHCLCQHLFQYLVPGWSDGQILFSRVHCLCQHLFKYLVPGRSDGQILFSRVHCLCQHLFQYLVPGRSDGLSSGAVGESRWPSRAVRPNKPHCFRGRKAILNHAHALVSACP